MVKTTKQTKKDTGEKVTFNKETVKETIKVTGDNLVKKVKDLIQEGNVRRITITDKKGKELASFPLTFGVVGAVLAPILAAIGAIAALVGECTISIERKTGK